MAWNISTYNLPRIRSYKEALDFYNIATPSPSGDGWRALGSKRDTSKIIRLDSNGDIRLRYHHTDVVLYTADGDLVVTTHNSSNTVAFANRFLPCGIGARSHDGCMYVGDTVGEYGPSHKVLTFLQSPTGNWFVDKTTVAPVTWYDLDRSKAAAIRKTMKPFLDWVAAARRVGAQLPTHQWGRRTPSWLKEFLPTGHIPEEKYAELATCSPEYRDLYVLGGAVIKLLAPCGALPKKNDYEDSPLWNYV